MEGVDERRVGICPETPAVRAVREEQKAAGRAVHDEDPLLAGDLHPALGRAADLDHEPRVVPGLLGGAVEVRPHVVERGQVVAAELAGDGVARRARSRCPCDRGGASP